MNLKEELLKLLEIKSYTGQEKDISDHIYNLLSEKGFFPKRIKNNVVCHLDKQQGEKEDEEKENIALIGHMDTIEPGSEAKTVEEDDKIFGLGSVDMKSGLSCMLNITEDLEKCKLKDKNILLCFYTGEEGPLPNGINDLIDSGVFKKTQLAIVLEPTNSEIEVGCLGTIMAEYVFEGKAAHSAFHWEGDDSVYKIPEFINKTINTETEKNKNFREGINITNIESSGPNNQIPEETKMTVNYRFSPYKSIEEAKNELKEKLGEPTRITDASPATIVRDNKYVEDVGNKKFSQFWTDIAQLNNSGIPTINFGPGSPYLAHSKNEHINLNELRSFYQNLIDFLADEH